MSSSSLCPNAAILPTVEIQEYAAGSHHSSDFFTPCFQMSQAESLFLFSFLKRGREGCSRVHL